MKKHLKTRLLRHSVPHNDWSGDCFVTPFAQHERETIKDEIASQKALAMTAGSRLPRSIQSFAMTVVEIASLRLNFVGKKRAEL